MPNYYEMLNVATTATIAEIQSAYDTQYNQWRRLVTHHDPNVVNQANQALQALETIRLTLSDPSKRSAYDAGIGLGAVSNLADPEMVLRMAPPRPTPPSQQIKRETPNATLWVCPQCKTNNPEHTQFCLKCGTQLVRECPKCKNISSLVSTGFCGDCGVNYEEGLRYIEQQKQCNEFLGQQGSVQQQKTTLLHEIELLQYQFQNSNKQSYSFTILLAAVAVLLCIAGVFVSASISTDSRYSSNLTLLFLLSYLFISPVLLGMGFVLDTLFNKSARTQNSKITIEIENKQGQVRLLDQQLYQIDKAITEIERDQCLLTTKPST